MNHKLRHNAASTSSSTLINEHDEEEQQKQSYRDTSNMHIFECQGTVQRIQTKQQRLNNNLTTKQQPMLNEQTTEEEEEDTFRVEPDDGTKRLNALFDSILSEDQPTTRPHSILKPKPPLGHLRGIDPFNNNHTRQPVEHTLSQQTQRVNGHTTNKSKSKSIHPNSSQNITTTRTGWRSGPVMTTRKSNSDTDSPEDAFKSIKPMAQDLTHHRDRSLPRRASFDHQKRVTFDDHKQLPPSRPVSSSAFGNLQSRHPPPPPSDSTDTEDLNDKTPLPGNNPHNPYGGSSNSRLDEDAQTTLATPRMAGYYPSTPATNITTLGPSTSRLVADEDAERRLEKLKNQAARTRMKRLSSVLDEERVPATTKASRLTMDHKPVQQQPPSSPPSHQSLDRNGKGKEKEVQSSDPVPSQSASNPQPELANPANNNNNNAAAAEGDQTVINAELTRGSCLPTPHLPGWFPATPGPTHRPSSSARAAQQRPNMRPSDSALKQGGRRAPVAGARQSHEAAGFHPYMLDSLDTEDVTPRPAKRAAARRHHPPTTTTTTSLPPASDSSLVPAPTTQPLNPDFSAPSFAGFDDARRQFLLTSTPAHPGAQKASSLTAAPGPLPAALPTPPSAAAATATDAAPRTEMMGPTQRLKDLAAAVIESVVEKNPFEALADRFSRSKERSLHQAIRTRNAEPSAGDHQQKREEELDSLLMSAHRVEQERARILARLDRLHLASHQPSLVHRLLAKLAAAFLSSSSAQKSLPRSSAPSASWKLAALAILCQLWFLWLAFHLSTVRGYHYMMQEMAGGGRGVPLSLQYMRGGRLAGIVGVGQEEEEDQGGLGEEVREVARFLAHWFAGFPAGHPASLPPLIRWLPAPPSPLNSSATNPPLPDTLLLLPPLLLVPT